MTSALAMEKAATADRSSDALGALAAAMATTSINAGCRGGLHVKRQRTEDRDSPGVCCNYGSHNHVARECPCYVMSGWRTSAAGAGSGEPSPPSAAS